MLSVYSSNLLNLHFSAMLRYLGTHLHKSVRSCFINHYRVPQASITSCQNLQIRSKSDKTYLGGVSHEQTEGFRKAMKNIYLASWPFFTGLNIIWYTSDPSHTYTLPLIVVNVILYGGVLVIAKKATSIATSVVATKEGQLEITTVNMLGQHKRTQLPLDRTNIICMKNTMATEGGKKYYIPWILIEEADDKTWKEFEEFDKFSTYSKYISPSDDIRLCKNFGRDDLVKLKGEGDELKEIKAEIFLKQSGLGLSVESTDKGHLLKDESNCEHLHPLKDESRCG